MEPTTQISSAYRILLAISIALFLHTLMLALADSWSSPAPEEPVRSVQVRLTAPSESDLARQATTPSQPEQTTEPRENEIRPLAETITPVVTTADAELSAQADEVDESLEGDQPAQETAEPSPTEGATPSESSVAQEAATAGAAGSRDDTSEVRQLSTQQARKMSDYELELMRLIARQARFDPAHEQLVQLEQRHTAVIELHLMRNGALRRATVITSSGVEQLDQLARRAALAASPYPEPPREERSRNLHFQVEVGFDPLRQGN